MVLLFNKFRRMNTRARTIAAALAATTKYEEDTAAAAVEFRILSDLHLEFYASANELLVTIPWNPARDARSFLLLAGDVGYPLGEVENSKYRALLDALATRFRGVFLVAGNHEYYQCTESHATMADVDAALDGLCRSLHRPSRPVVFLQKQAWTLIAERADGSAHTTQLVGCTMWSPVTATASMQLNDRHFVGVEAPWIRAVHTEHAGWLRRTLSASLQQSTAPSQIMRPAPPPSCSSSTDEEVRTVVVVHEEEEEEEEPPPPNTTLIIRCDGSIIESADRQLATVYDRRVVMTHHLPTGRPPPTSAFQHLLVAASRDSAYYADLFRRGDSWPEDAYPDLWVCGHLHSQERRRVGRTEVISCCHGYSVGQLAEAGRMAELAWRPTEPVYCRDAARHLTLQNV